MMSEQELKELRNQLAKLSPDHVLDFYQSAYTRCNVTGRHFPSARTIQELVQAWKLLRKWRRRE